MESPAQTGLDGHGDNFKPNSMELLEGRAPTQQYFLDDFLDEYAKGDWIAPWDIGSAQPSLIHVGIIEGL